MLVTTLALVGVVFMAGALYLNTSGNLSALAAASGIEQTQADEAQSGGLEVSKTFTIEEEETPMASAGKLAAAANSSQTKLVHGIAISIAATVSLLIAGLVALLFNAVRRRRE